jgi:hypothetical protein
MKVAVWDTYVKRIDGKTMHFDILVQDEMKDEQKIYAYGRLYLNGKEVLSDELTAKECKYCHIEEASEEIKKTIESKGFHVVEIKNCV